MLYRARPLRRSTRVFALFVATILLSNSVFAAPEAASYVISPVGEIGNNARSTWQKADLSRFLEVDLPKTLALIAPKNAKAKSAAEFDRIEISQRDRSIAQGEGLDFVATAYRGEQTVGGVSFRWSFRKAEGEESRPMANGRFRAALPGRYIVQVSSGGYSAETNITVLADPAFNVTRIMRKPERERTPAEQKQVAEWNASGLLSTHAVSSRDRQPAPVKSTPRQKAKTKTANANRIDSAPPIGWDNSSYATADDPINWVGRPIGAASKKGAANGNYNLSIPAVNLDGRGDLAINLNLEYNSRLWSQSGTEMTYDADAGYPAPGWNLGYGKMYYTGTSGGCIFVSPDGTRHSYGGSSSLYNVGGLYTDTFSGYTTDGSMIEYGCQYYSSGYGSYITVTGWAKMPNGMWMTLGSPSANFDQTFPTTIADRHGNYINITYEGGYGPEIEAITDTLGRTIDFNYDGNGLRSITGPGYNGTTRTFIYFDYYTQTIGTSGMFGSPITATNVANTSVNQFKGIYYPTTNTGYWFCGSAWSIPCGTDAYSPYGILRTIKAQRGMSVSIGSIYPGTTNREEVYDFPTATSTSYTDSPGYSTHTETFDGIDTSSLVTNYSKTTSGSYETIEVERPDGSWLIQKSNISDGLQVENRIENSSSVVLDKTVTTLGSGGSGDFYSPRPTAIERTDDKGQVTKTTFTYGTSLYNQVTEQKEYDYPGTNLYREKRFTYENGSAYTSRNIFSLVKSEAVYNASSIRLSLTEYSYDQSAPIGIPDSGGDAIVHLLSNYNPDTSATLAVCMVFNHNDCYFEGQTFWDGEEYIECECENFDYISTYDYLTAYRGNVTQVTKYEDAATPAGGIDYDFTYDAAGNERTTTTNCCQQIGSDYTVNTQYSMPASVTKGSSNPMSSDRITQSYTYDANTKVPTAITDFNGLSTTIAYDAVLRPTQVTLNSGGKKQTTYTDSGNYVTEHVKKADNTTVSNSSVYFNGRGQPTKKTYQAGASNHNATSFQYDDILRKRKVSRPYDSASSPSYWTVTEFDILGRTVSQISPDTASTTTMTYNPTPTPTPATSNDGQTVTATDAWGRQRWTRYDAFGRLVEVVEPDPAGSTGSVSGSGTITTTYAYDQLDRLTTITQGTGSGGQTRSFAYDSLGRLIFQKLPEQEAFINSSGGYNTGTLLWSDAFEYDARSNLKKRTDARGVITTYDYTVSSSPDPLNRLQSISYNNSQSDPTIHAAPTVTFDYMTTGDKTRVKKVTTTGVSTEENTFDGEGRVASYELILAAHTGKPFKTEYTYDTAHRLTQVKYPKRYGITLNSVADPQMLVGPSYDEASRLSQMDVNSDMVNNDAILSNVSYNTAGQLTSLKTATAETHPRVESYSYDAATGLLTGQTLKNAALSSTFLDLSYSYDRGASAGSGSTTGLKTGQMTKIQNNLDNDRDRKYEFDALGRLKKAKGGIAAGASGGGVAANWTQEYTYDRYGNKTATAALSGSIDQNSAAVPADGLTSTATDTETNRITSFDYDRAGNILRGQNASGVWQRFEYDAAGRLKKVQNNSSVDIETYTYGAGRQKLKVDVAGGDTTYYVWGGDSIIAEYLLISSNPRYQKAYVYAGSRLLMTTGRASSTTESRQTHHPDRLGTKRLTDIDSGAEIEQSTLPFGTAFGAESTGYSNQVFTSYDRSSATGLDYANNRTYSSGQGRFIQVDPIGMSSASIGNPQSNNLYVYTQNMPTDFVDPSGLMMIPFTRTVCLPWDGGRRVCYEEVVHWMDTGSGSGEGGDFGGGGGGNGVGRNNGPQAVFDRKKFKDCLSRLFNARPGSFFAKNGLVPGGRGDLMFSGQMDGKGVTVTTRMDRDSVDLGLSLKNAGSGDGSPQSGATFGSYPLSNNIASDVWRNSANTAIGILALGIHELGNALAGQRYLDGGSKKQIKDYTGGRSDHNDAGVALENCVFGGTVGLRSGRVGNSREFRR